ncbi:MAG: C25 family cysteine peptidase, partial [Promethearchaeota archaeon]
MVATATPSFAVRNPSSSSSSPAVNALDTNRFEGLTEGVGSLDDRVSDEEREWYWRDAKGSWQDYRDSLASYRQAAERIRHRQTSYFTQMGSGMLIQEQVDGNQLRITVCIGSYSILSYAFDEGMYQTVIVEDAEISTGYGHPTLPYKNLLFSLPANVYPLSVRVNSRLMESIDGLSLVPGPEPLRLASTHPYDPALYFDEQAYSASSLVPTSLVDYREVGMRGTKGLFVKLSLMQYNPVQKHANLVVALELDITFSEPITSEVLHVNPYESQFNGAGQDYVIIAPSSFVPSLGAFQKWKQDLGYDVSIMPVETIYATYSGRDYAERMRTFIQASYTQNNTLYFFLIGDGDVVPTREVWDPYLAGGLDNGTEPSDMYFECLDGDWDANGNSLFGETDDNVDFFPEVLVGRIPVQTVTQAEDVLDAIIQLESNPAPGSWMNDVLLIGPDCFGWGDGANMIEEELNQQFLYDSFFDVYRTYPTDGSLSNANVINRINTGVGIVDFFDHGWYGGWVGALDEESGSEVSNLLNGAKTPFAFAMACETAAFDAEAYEPTIGEAFFRNPNGGAVAYIGATRIAWAGYYAFDGLHNRFWHYFFDTALTEWYASPKLALHAARQEMVTTYSMTDPVSLETVYQAIYFGDPSMSLYWKHNVTNSATQVEINEVVQLNGTCNLLYNNTPISDTVNVLVRDPLGRVVYNSPHITDSQGKYTTTFMVSEVAGNYTVETTTTQPFAYTAVNTFYVGNQSLTLQLDSAPQYFNFLDFSGSTTADGTGNATLLDPEGNLLSSKLFTITGGAYSESLNLTAFGWLILHVTLESGIEHGGVSTTFLVQRGDILVIADDTGAYGPDYPGGWAADNRGDSTNLGDYYVALKSEYTVSIFYPRYEREPSLSLLHTYDAVIVTVGDNFGYPLISPDSFLLDVLFSYHNSGGQILFEGCLMSEDLANSMHNATFKSLTHTEHVKNIANTGSLTLENTLHTITSGLPATIALLDGLGTPYADVITAFNGSTRVSGYVGEVAPHAAITALTPTPTYGGVVYIGFSIDAISNQDHRTLLIQNAIAFLLQPSIEAILSDDALQTGTTETIIIEVFEAATGQPISGAEVTFNGCGISATNHSTSFGNCSIIITPTSSGIITVQITKYGFLNLTGAIIVYDLPIIEVNTIPTYLVRTAPQDLVVIATNYYEQFPLDGCFINITGCGVSDTGFTNSSGMVEFTVSPTISGLISIHANLSAYVNVTSSIGVRLIALVLPSAGTEYPSDFCWDEINQNWQDYGTIPLFINYTTFAGTNTGFTLQDLVTSNADALIIPYLFEPYSTQEIEAIKAYIHAGHGLFASAFALALHSESMGSFFGVKDDLFFDTYYGLSNLNKLQPGHAIFLNLADPFTTSYPLTFYPMGTGWDLSVLNGASYLAMDTSGS